MTTPQLDRLAGGIGAWAPPAAPPAPRSAIAVALPARVSPASRRVDGLVARLPAIVRATRAGVHGTLGVLQAFPDQTLRSLAATSVGFGVGLSFTRARRLAIVAGMLPAVLAAAAIAARPAGDTPHRGPVIP